MVNTIQYPTTQQPYFGSKKSSRYSDFSSYSTSANTSPSVRFGEGGGPGLATYILAVLLGGLGLWGSCGTVCNGPKEYSLARSGCSGEWDKAPKGPGCQWENPVTKKISKLSAIQQSVSQRIENPTSNNVPIPALWEIYFTMHPEGFYNIMDDVIGAEDHQADLSEEEKTSLQKEIPNEVVRMFFTKILQRNLWPIARLAQSKYSVEDLNANADKMAKAVLNGLPNEEKDTKGNYLYGKWVDTQDRNGAPKKQWVGEWIIPPLSSTFKPEWHVEINNIQVSNVDPPPKTDEAFIENNAKEIAIKTASYEEQIQQKLANAKVTGARGDSMAAAILSKAPNGIEYMNAQARVKASEAAQEAAKKGNPFTVVVDASNGGKANVSVPSSAKPVPKD